MSDHHSSNGPGDEGFIRIAPSDSRAVMASCLRRGKARRTDGGRLTNSSSAASGRLDPQTLYGVGRIEHPQRLASATDSSAADHAASAAGSAITDAVCRADRSTIGFFGKFRKKLSLILIEAEPLGSFCPE